MIGPLFLLIAGAVFIYYTVRLAILLVMLAGSIFALICCVVSLPFAWLFDRWYESPNRVWNAPLPMPSVDEAPTIDPKFAAQMSVAAAASEYVYRWQQRTRGVVKVEMVADPDAPFITIVHGDEDRGEPVMRDITPPRRLLGRR